MIHPLEQGSILECRSSWIVKFQCFCCFKLKDNNWRHGTMLHPFNLIENCSSLLRNYLDTLAENKPVVVVPINNQDTSPQGQIWCSKILEHYLWYYQYIANWVSEAPYKPSKDKRFRHLFLCRGVQSPSMASRLSSSYKSKHIKCISIHF